MNACLLQFKKEPYPYRSDRNTKETHTDYEPKQKHNKIHFILVWLQGSGRKMRREKLQRTENENTHLYVVRVQHCHGDFLLRGVTFDVAKLNAPC